MFSAHGIVWTCISLKITSLPSDRNGCTSHCAMSVTRLFKHSRARERLGTRNQRCAKESARGHVFRRRCSGSNRSSRQSTAQSEQSAHELSQAKDRGKLLGFASPFVTPVLQLGLCHTLFQISRLENLHESTAASTQVTEGSSLFLPREQHCHLRTQRQVYLATECPN